MKFCNWRIYIDRSWHETIFKESLLDIYHYYGIKSSSQMAEGNLMNF